MYIRYHNYSGFFLLDVDPGDDSPKLTFDRASLAIN